MNLYYAYIHSKINYGSQLYGTASKTLPNIIQVLQNKAIKILFNIDILLYEYKLLSVKKCTLQFFHKQRTNTLSGVFNNYFKTNNEMPSNHITRQSKLLHLDKVNIEQAKCKIKYKVCEIWNFLSNELQLDMTKLKPVTLKKTVHEHYLYKYNTYIIFLKHNITQN